MMRCDKAMRRLFALLLVAFTLNPAAALIAAAETESIPVEDYAEGLGEGIPPEGLYESGEIASQDFEDAVPETVIEFGEEMAPDDGSGADDTTVPDDATEQGDPTEQGGSTEQNDPTEQSDSTEQNDPSEQSGSTEQNDPSEQSGSTEQNDPSEQSDPIEQGSSSEQGDPIDQGDPLEQSDPVDQGGPSEQSDPTEQNIPTEQSIPTEQTDPTEQSNPAEQNIPPEQNNPTEQSNPTDQNIPTEQSNPTEQNIPTDQNTPPDQSNPTEQGGSTEQGDSVIQSDPINLDDIAELSESLDPKSVIDLEHLFDTVPTPTAEPTYDMEAVKVYLAGSLSAKISGYSTLQSMAKAWDKQHKEYLKSESQYRKQRSRYNQGKKEYEAALAQYQEGKKKYDEGFQQYKDGTEELKKGSAALSEARQKRDESEAQLQEGEAQYEENLAKYEDGVQQQSDAIAQVEKLPESRWIVMNCRGNSSFVQLLLGSSNLASLEMTFSMLFVLVGALVIYATISKMIDEQRSLVGAGKALGLFNREIFAKYLLFGMTGTMLGTALGILTARFLMEVYVLKSAGSYYTFDTTKPTLIVAPTIVALVAGGLLALLATWFACTKLMRSTAIQLMQPKVPAGRKKAASGKHVLPLYSRLILLNIRSDLRRVIVTIVSVAGCCALVVIGFTLKSAVEGALQKQYDRVVNYDGRIKYDVDAGENASAEIKQLLDGEGIEYTEFYDGVVTFRIRDILVGELLCGDIAQISDFYHLLDWKTDEPLSPTDDGILIQKRTAESYDLEVGSELELTLANSQRATVRVAGIFDNYIGRVMVMSRTCYRETFGEDCVDNQLYIRLGGASEAHLLEELMKIDGYDSYGRSDSDKALFASSSTLVIAIVALFIFMAAVMAGVVLTNLTNSYILQKKRELTIMRINGFTVKEVIGYVTRETVFTTIVGTITGIAMGALIAYKITRSLETAFVQYNRSISLPAWAFGAIITAFFTILINVIVLRQVKHLKLTDMT